MASKTTKQRRAVAAMMEEGRTLSKDPGRIRKKSNRRWRVRSGTFAFLWHHVIVDALGMWCSCSLQESPGLCRHIAPWSTLSPGPGTWRRRWPAGRSRS